MDGPIAEGSAVDTETVPKPKMITTRELEEEYNRKARTIPQERLSMEVPAPEDNLVHNATVVDCGSNTTIAGSIVLCETNLQGRTCLNINDPTGSTNGDQTLRTPRSYIYENYINTEQFLFRSRHIFIFSLSVRQQSPNPLPKN